MRPKVIVGTCLGMFVLSAGCLNLEDPPSVRQESKVPVLDAWAKQGARDGGKVQDNWVDSFNDPALDALVHEALANNRDIQAAAARRDQAIAIAKRVGADLYPSADLLATANGTTGKVPPTSTSGLFAAASWELDLWGRVRYLTQSATADVVTAQGQLEFARQSIAAQVAETYYLAVSNELRLRNAQEQLGIQKEIDRIQQVKSKEGQSGKFEAQLSRADLERFSADVQNYQAALEMSLRALEVLLGRFPAAEVHGAQALPEMNAPIPAGLPSQLLERRPDIIAARAAVESAFFLKESAKANLLPRISLTAQGGYTSNELHNLLNVHNLGGVIGANLAQPIFDGGARFADIEAAKAAQRQAVAQYASVALTAFREVQDGLANLVYYGELASQLKQSSADMDIAMPIAQTRYLSGDLSLLNFKQVQTQAYQTKDAAILAQYSLVQQRIQLHLALGGSIIAPPTTQPAAGVNPTTIPAAYAPAPTTVPVAK